MHPERELARLVAHKAVLQRRIAFHRAQTCVAAGRVVQPLTLLDQLLALWRRVAPLATVAAVPLGLFAARTISRRLKLIGSLVRWGLLAFGAVRGFRSAVKRRSHVATPVRAVSGRHHRRHL